MANGAKRPGRPPVDATSKIPSADMHLTLPATDYDKVYRLASSNRESPQEFIRRSLKRLLEDERG